MRTLIRLLMLLVAVGLPAVAAGTDGDFQEDTFAIAAEGEDVSAKVAFLSGPAPFFHLYDINGDPIEVLANPHLNLEFGIGPAAAATLAKKGVTVLVGGMAGPKMRDMLDANGVRFVPRSGTVDDVVQELQQ